jgi:hypothetical protein
MHAMSRARAAFNLAVAATAAALGAPCVEGLSNSGAFGPGAWTDRSNADVVPMLCLALLFACTFVIALARRAVDPTQAAALRTDAAPSGTNAVAAFALQIALLFAMETVEQIVVWGHPLGGTVWLGGPLLVSLAIHALFGIGVAAVLSRTLCRLAGHVADVIRLVRRLVVAWSPKPPLRLTTEHAALRRLAEPVIRRTKGRAPPHRLLHSA